MINEIYLIRHGQSEVNDLQDRLPREKKVLWNRSNWSELTPSGIEQAMSVGDFFNGEKIQLDKIVSSPAIRAQQTARYALRRMLSGETFYRALECIDLVLDLQERSFGDWFLVPKVCPEIIDYETRLKTDPDFNMDFRPPQGESNRDVGRRAKGYIEDNLTGYRTVAVFSHRCCISNILIAAFGANPLDIFKLYMGPGSVSRMRHDGNRWIDYQTEIFVPRDDRK